MRKTRKNYGYRKAFGCGVRVGYAKGLKKMSYPKYDLASAERKYDKYDSKVDNELRQQNYQRKRNLKDTKLYNKYH